MQYYDDVQYIAQVNDEDSIEGKIERWEAHRNGILHRALTIAVYINDSILLQKRKHPVFDSVFDITVSTHQIYVDDILQSDEETIYQTLERELLLKPESLKQKPEYKGNVMYQANDPKSDFIEHEVCHVYTCVISSIPLFDPAFAYEVKMVSVDDIKNLELGTHLHLAPWVKEMIKKDMV